MAIINLNHILGGVGTSDDFEVNGALLRQEKIYTPAAYGKAGATATVGYVNTGTNLPQVTLAASATADTWVIPINSLHIGDVISAFSVQAQIESAGGTVTLDAALRKVTNVAAEPTDAAVGSITQVSVTADTAVDAEKTGLWETVAIGELFYVLITCTTAASTDVQLLGTELTVVRGTE